MELLVYTANQVAGLIKCSEYDPRLGSNVQIGRDPRSFSGSGAFHSINQSGIIEVLSSEEVSQIFHFSFSLENSFIFSVTVVQCTYNTG